ncbi:MAG: hypothetical protein ACEQSB_00130 [Undibacterium sp.]
MSIPNYPAGKVEISFDVKIDACLRFFIESEKWAAMADDEKRAEMDRQMDRFAMMIENDQSCIIAGHSCNDSITGELVGPEAKDINLAEVQIYDPAKWTHRVRDN